MILKVKNLIKIGILKEIFFFYIFLTSLFDLEKKILALFPSEKRITLKERKKDVRFSKKIFFNMKRIGYLYTLHKTNEDF